MCQFSSDYCIFAENGLSLQTETISDQLSKSQQPMKKIVLFVVYSVGLILISYIVFSKQSPASTAISYEFVGEDTINDNFEEVRSMYIKKEDPFGVYNKPEGIIPNPDVAIHIAEKILIPIYDSVSIVSQRPYKVELLNSYIWYVHGQKKSNSEGGTFSILIDKNDGRIISISHGK